MPRRTRSTPYSFDLLAFGQGPLVPATLLKAYRSSRYGFMSTASKPVEFPLRQFDPFLPVELHRLGAKKNGVLLSARNPRSRLLDEGENLARDERLKRLCRKMGIRRIDAWGEDPKGHHPREVSHLLLDCPHDYAQHLARSFEQWAYVSVELRSALGLFVECVDGCYRPDQGRPAQVPLIDRLPVAPDLRNRTSPGNGTILVSEQREGGAPRFTPRSAAIAQLFWLSERLAFEEDARRENILEALKAVQSADKR